MSIMCDKIHSIDTDTCPNYHNPEFGVCYKGHPLILDLYTCYLGHTAYGYKENPVEIKDKLSHEIIATLKSLNIRDVLHTLKKYSSRLFHKSKETSKYIKHIEQLKEKYTNLENEINTFKQSIITLDCEISKLHVSVVQLHNENKKLKDTINLLNDKISLLSFENTTLQLKNTELMTSYFSSPSIDLTCYEQMHHNISPRQMTSKAPSFIPKPDFIILPQARNSPK